MTKSTMRTLPRIDKRWKHPPNLNMINLSDARYTECFVYKYEGTKTVVRVTANKPPEPDPAYPENR